jgi:hypothetical protein
MKTTIGQILVNDQLPEDMRAYGRTWDQNTTKDIFRELAEKHPDDYADVARKLTNVSREAAYLTGGASFGLRHLRAPPSVRESRIRLTRKIQNILDDPRLDQAKKNDEIVKVADAERTHLLETVPKETFAANNPLAMQVKSGARGSASGLLRLLSGDILYLDHKENVIPLAIQRSYSEGLTPADYWAATFGARKGLIDIKLNTGETGYLAKQLAQVSHRLITTAIDDDNEPATIRGMPVDTADTDNVGALLSAPAGGYPRNTILTPKILAELRSRKIPQILVRSPMVGGPEGGGVYSRDVGVREKGTLAPLGDMVGLAASQSVGERLTQTMLGSKHVGGVKRKATAQGFEAVNQILQVPKHYPGGATHATVDGVVDRIDPAPAGGTNVTIGGEGHFVAPDAVLKVKKGDTVEAGDVLSDGLPNPAEVVKHKGIGEGRRYFMHLLTNTLRDSGLPVHRRNVELLSRGLINYVEMTDEDDEHVPGDVLPYSQLERSWKPRHGAELSDLRQATGKYLEHPVLHYSIGTQIRPSMLPQFKQFGVKNVLVHTDPPPFVPTMIRAETAIQEDPDFITRLFGSGQKKTLLDAAHRGGVSDIGGSSFVPAQAVGTPMGTTWPKIALRPAT